MQNYVKNISLQKPDKRPPRGNKQKLCGHQLKLSRNRRLPCLKSCFDCDVHVKSEVRALFFSGVAVD